MTLATQSAPAARASVARAENDIDDDGIPTNRSGNESFAKIATRWISVMRVAVGLTAFLLAVALWGGTGRATPPDAVELVQSHLYAGRTAEAAEAVQVRLEEVADDDQARFALGAVQFIQAIERLAQSMYRHGLRSSAEVFVLPFFRLPVADNPEPEPFTYEGARMILQRFVNDLALSEQTLGAVDDPGVKLPLNIGLVRLDMNADGEITEDETLWRIFQRIAPLRQITEAQAQQFVIDFDRSDVPWLRAYCHLLMGLAEFFLAHDWHVAFEHTFHALFPQAGLPFSILNDKAAHNPEFAVYSEVADLLAFVHLNHWPVAESERMAQTLAHLESMVALSRASWQLILSEKDNENEWIPNPAQTGVIPGMTVTQDRVGGWLLFLDEFEALLQGRKLLPHWRLAKGINLRRVFLEPSTFDLVLWIQGSAAFPYLEEGELSAGETWERMFDLFQGDFFSYAIWFN